jgi:hypothetical protein
MIGKYGLETANWLMNEQYQHYKRLLFIVRGQADLDVCTPRARQMGVYMAQWKVRYEEVNGSFTYLCQLARAAFEIETVNAEFLVIELGVELR